MLAMQRRPWEQGVAAQALLEVGDFETMILLAKDSAYLQIPDGRLAMPDVAHAVTDPAVNGTAVLKAAELTGDAGLRHSAQRMADYLLYTAPRTADGILHHITTAPQLWIDSAYMAPPFLAIAGYPAEAVRQLEGLKHYLWNLDKKLFSHIWDDGKKAFERQDYWGVGNGWAAAGMMRVIMALPDSMNTQRQWLIESLKEVIDGCLVYQRTDGLFHNVVDQPATFVETNLAQMLAYSIYRGLQFGILDTSYQSHADVMRAAVHQQVDAYGFVQSVCGAPNFDRPGIATEGQAFFLLMEAAYADFAK
ncbi:MAG: glycoside hydrolase family 88 protein [Chloroflexi bacterium]|nr:glycoside hydrolase family 88 protein [Chloroflexota bacterium]